MPSRRLCTICGQVCERRGVSRCDRHSQRWSTRTKQLGWDWTQIRNAKLAQQPTCEVCGGVAVTVDHILARAFGGGHEWSNLRSLCRRCADAKDHADREEGRRRAASRRLGKK